jgi:hypothetical protein
MHFARSFTFLAALHVCMASDRVDSQTAGDHATSRNLAAGYTLVMDTTHREKMFFVCAPHEDTCVSARMIGWRRPFILTRDEGKEPGWSLIDTRSRKETQIAERAGLPAELKDIRLHPASVAWQNLSAAQALW